MERFLLNFNCLLDELFGFLAEILKEAAHSIAHLVSEVVGEAIGDCISWIWQKVTGGNVKTSAPTGSKASKKPRAPSAKGPVQRMR